MSAHQTAHKNLPWQAKHNETIEVNTIITLGAGIYTKHFTPKLSQLFCLIRQLNCTILKAYGSLAAFKD